MKIVIASDTSSLIILGKLERFDLLDNVFEKVLIPQHVYNETRAKHDGLAEILHTNPLFEVRQATDLEQISLLQNVLDKGESHAISLAKELKLPLLIDEKKGRSIALSMGLEVLGFIGVLLINHRQGKLSVKQAKSIFEAAQKEGFRVSLQLKKQFLKQLV